MKSYHKLFWGLFLQKRKGEIDNDNRFSGWEYIHHLDVPTFCKVRWDGIIRKYKWMIDRERLTRKSKQVKGDGSNIHWEL